MFRLVVASALLALSGGTLYFEPWRHAPALPSPAEVAVEVDLGRSVAQVSERFLSFAVDTAQVVGGDFWAPPGKGEGLLKTAAVGRYDFARPRLRKLAAALAPAYLRIGGTDADRTVYQMGDQAPPAGARWVLTRQRWDQVSDFARATDLRLVFTLNAGPAARDAEGNWDPESARPLVEHARRRGDPVAVWELGNEINAYPLMHHRWVTVDRYAGDLARARGLLGPDARLAGPSSAFWPVFGELRGFSGPLLQRAGGLLDVVSWHYYPQQSHRCPVATRRAVAGHMLAPDELADVERWAARIEEQARAGAPGAELWLGETGGAQCGGEPGLSDAFADSLWWLDELGRVARRGHAVVVRQTLSGSDYGLIDDQTLEPNPSYWASWLWHDLMGTRALQATPTLAAPYLRSYAHCAPGGGVSLLLVNVGDREITVDRTGGDGVVYQLQANGLGARTVRLNGVELHPAADGGPPALESFARPAPRALRLAPLSAAFVVMTHAQAPACIAGSTRASL